MTDKLNRAEDAHDDDLIRRGAAIGALEERRNQYLPDSPTLLQIQLDIRAIAALPAVAAPGDDLVAQAEAALDGVTGGPWAVEYKHGTTRLLMGNEVAMCDETYYPWTPENDKDWHFIAFARQWVPEAAARLSALTAQVAELQALVSASEAHRYKSVSELLARLARMEGALEFYADESTYETQYERLPCECCTDIYEPINNDKGAIARAALTEPPADGGKHE